MVFASAWWLLMVHIILARPLCWLCRHSCNVALPASVTATDVLRSIASAVLATLQQVFYLMHHSITPSTEGYNREVVFGSRNTTSLLGCTFKSSSAEWCGALSKMRSTLYASFYLHMSRTNSWRRQLLTQSMNDLPVIHTLGLDFQYTGKLF